VADTMASAMASDHRAIRHHLARRLRSVEAGNVSIW
jgi:hypothetical protein